MPKDDRVTLPPNQPVRLTDDPVTAVRVHNPEGNRTVLLKAAQSSSVAPAFTNAVPLEPGQTLLASILLADLFPALGTNAVHLWATCPETATVGVEHV